MHIKRSVRVAELIKREISAILAEDTNDPEIKFVTITSVKVTEDLKLSKIYFTTLGDRKQRQVVTEHLKRATNFIRNMIGSRLALKYTPELKFYYDTLSDHVENIERLFLKIREESNN